MKVDGKVIHFNIFKGMQHSFEESSINALDTTNDLVIKAQSLCANDTLVLVICDAVFFSQSMSH